MAQCLPAGLTLSTFIRKDGWLVITPEEEFKKAAQRRWTLEDELVAVGAHLDKDGKWRGRNGKLIDFFTEDGARIGKDGKLYDRNGKELVDRSWVLPALLRGRELYDSNGLAIVKPVEFDRFFPPPIPQTGTPYLGPAPPIQEYHRQFLEKYCPIIIAPGDVLPRVS